MTHRRRFHFAGDHDEKQVARLMVYKHALLAPIQGHSIILAGTDPEIEISLLRDYLKWPAERSWIVDRSTYLGVQNALKRAQKSWPTANVRNIDVYDLVAKLGSIGFINLDFMGTPLQQDNIQCLEEVIPRMLPGSIFGYTWLRGREYIQGHPSSKLLWKLGKGYKGNDRRWAGLITAISNISKNTMHLVDKCEYLSNHSPMAVGIFRCDGMH